MPDTTYRILMNGVTGRMGYRQHLVRSILAIRDDGGVPLPDGDRLQVEPVLIGRNRDKLAELAGRARRRRLDHRPRRGAGGGRRADLLRRPGHQRAQEGDPQGGGSRQARLHREADRRVGRRGAGARRRRRAAGIINGVVHDKLYLPGLMKLKRLDRRAASSAGSSRSAASSATGSSRVTSSAGAATQLELPRRGRRRDGARHVLPLELRAGEPVRPGRGRHGQGRHPHPRALGRARRARTPRPPTTRRTASSSSTATSSPRSTRPGRCGSIASELVEFQVDGTHGSAVAGLFDCRIQPRAQTPKPVWNPDLPTDEDFRGQWEDVPDNEEFGNGFRAQWERFLRDVDAGRPHHYDLAAGRPRPAARRGRTAVVARGTAGGAVTPQRHDDARHRHDPDRRRRAASPSHLREPRALDRRTRSPFRSRVAFAAAHVVADPHGENVPGAPAALDWDSTLAFRRHLFRYGFGVAEAMDTAQRNMGLDWPAVAGAGPPQRRPGPRPRRPDRGRRRHRPRRPPDHDPAGPRRLRRTGRVRRGHRLPGDPDGVAPARRRGHRPRRLPQRVRPTCSGRSREPVILHWLGEAFDPQLRGYWGSVDTDAATDDVPRAGPRARRQGRRGEGLAAVGRRTRSGCGPICRTAYASTPATTSTTRR